MSSRRSLSDDRISPLEPTIAEQIKEDPMSIFEQPVINSETAGKGRGPSWFIVRVTAIASLGGILFGYDLGVIAGALPLVTTDFDLSSRQQETLVAILYLGGGLGAAVGGALCDQMGRKQTILITDVIFFVGALMFGFATVYWHLLLARVVVGWAVAVSGVADVSYLHELAPPHIRGAIVSVNEACIALGFLFAFGVGGGLRNIPQGWRYMFGLSGLLALIQFIGMQGMPESPKWLSQNGRHEESRAAQRRIQPMATLSRSESAAIVVEEMVQSPVKRDPRHHVDVLPPSLPVDATWAHKIRYSVQFISFLVRQSVAYCDRTSKLYWRQAVIATFLSVGQQLSGQAIVVSYGPLIFAGPGGDVDKVDPRTTLSVGIVKFIVTCLVIWRVDYIGRRPLLLAGLGAICTGLLVLCTSFIGSSLTEDPGASGGVKQALALIGVWLVVLGYSASYGPLTWLLTSELFPTEIRGRALVSTFTA